MLMRARRTAGEKETQLQLRRDAHACQEDCWGKNLRHSSSRGGSCQENCWTEGDTARDESFLPW